MKVCVFSNDPRLEDLCLQVVRELCLDNCEVIVADPKQSVAADLFVWDLDHNALPHSSLHALKKGEAQGQLFIVDRQQVDEFLRTLPLGAGSTIIRPVSRSTLQIFVEQVAAGVKVKQSDVRPISGHASETDRNDLLQCLLMANLKLQQYEQNRTNFLARVVYDLRAPLTAASGYSGLLREQVLGPLNRDQMDLLRRMEHSLKKLTRVASEMFELSLGAHKDRRLELKECSMETCLRAALHEVEPFAEEKNIAINLKLSDAVAPLYCDPEQIEQVLVNLLENAFKFTPKGGQVYVRGYPTRWTSPTNYLGHGEWGNAQRQDNVLSVATVYRIDVSDTGIGISTENLEDLFEEYTSYSGSQDRSGGGLGLAICRMILKAHGGYIWAENHSTGARLSLVLPLGDLSNRKPIRLGRQLRATSPPDSSFTEGRSSCN